MIWVILIFILVPAIEISLFIWLGQMIGGWSIFLLILLTGIGGALLAKYQGMETWRKVQEAIQLREMPHEHLLDGVLIFVGSVLMITPGFITDIIGLLLILPFTRKPFKLMVKLFIAKRLAKGTRIIYRKW